MNTLLAAMTSVIAVYAILMIVVIAAHWKIYTKAGQPGWACLVPIYNILVLLKICGKPGWWFIMFLIPLVNVVFMILTLVSLAKSFGKGGGFVAGLILLPFIFVPILGFGDAAYVGPDGVAAPQV